METSERVRRSLDKHTILMVEDNEDDVFMMNRAFKKAGIPNLLQVAKDGEEALNYLEGRGDFQDRIKYPFPLVMFLDLNMPKKGGLEVLEQIRQHPELRKLTINVLSSSTRPADIERAAFLGANAYYIKPTQIEKFQELIRDWYSLNRFIAYPGSTWNLGAQG